MPPLGKEACRGNVCREGRYSFSVCVCVCVSSLLARARVFLKIEISLAAAAADAGLFIPGHCLRWFFYGPLLLLLLLLSVFPREQSRERAGASVRGCDGLFIYSPWRFSAELLVNYFRWSSKWPAFAERVCFLFETTILIFFSLEKSTSLYGVGEIFAFYRGIGKQSWLTEYMRYIALARVKKLFREITSDVFIYFPRLSMDHR